ncbi:MAG: hypothetical protein GTO63_15535 [Anaerolineae bacterium]|nr:hypothetical protein [Anaerolineae bacterium]NIN96241.1 hypothetical protein [Anaerolineae bacterium]NIQ79261.1 hypothetical protein [Anaerolineae bacterium]
MGSVALVELDDRTLVALMAAIIHRPGEDRVEAVEAAKHILELVELPTKRKRAAQMQLNKSATKWWDYVEGKEK